MHLIIVYLIGVIFGTGIVVSGMANPAKVINFFDIAGTWDPSLAFVMGGALPALGTGRIEVILFTAALIGGIFAAKFLQNLSRPKAEATS